MDVGGGFRLVELGGQLLAGLLAEGLLDKLTGIPARRACKTPGLDSGFALWADNNLNGLSCGTSSDLDNQFNGAIGQCPFP